jgi:hypothetical protein
MRYRYTSVRVYRSSDCTYWYAGMRSTDLLVYNSKLWSLEFRVSSTKATEETEEAEGHIDNDCVSFLTPILLRR